MSNKIPEERLPVTLRMRRVLYELLQDKVWEKKRSGDRSATVTAELNLAVERYMESTYGAVSEEATRIVEGKGVQFSSPVTPEVLEILKQERVSEDPPISKKDEYLERIERLEHMLENAIKDLRGPGKSTPKRAIPRKPPGGRKKNSA